MILSLISFLLSVVVYDKQKSCDDKWEGNNGRIEKTLS